MGAGAASFAIVIPARFASSRFPGKPLAMLRGCSGTARTLIERSWEAACGAAPASRVWVATDDDRVAAEVRRFGGQVVMTPASCRNGTERCAAALEAIGAGMDVVVNFQGDAPLTPPQLVAGLVSALSADESAAMTTPALRCSPGTLAHLRADEAQGRVGGTTVVFDDAERALYFSKRIIPYVGADEAEPAKLVHLHLGIYAYRREALRDYAGRPPSRLELAEGLEQLRFLEAGYRVRVVPSDPVGWDCIELNNPTDVAAIESVLRDRGMP